MHKTGLKNMLSWVLCACTQATRTYNLDSYLVFTLNSYNFHALMHVSIILTWFSTTMYLTCPWILLGHHYKQMNTYYEHPFNFILMHHSVYPHCKSLTPQGKVLLNLNFIHVFIILTVFSVFMYSVGYVHCILVTHILWFHGFYIIDLWMIMVL